MENPSFSQAAVVYTCTTSCRAHVLRLISNQGLSSLKRGSCQRFCRWSSAASCLAILSALKSNFASHFKWQSSPSVFIWIYNHLLPFSCYLIWAGSPSQSSSSRLGNLTWNDQTWFKLPNIADLPRAAICGCWEEYFIVSWGLASNLNSEFMIQSFPNDCCGVLYIPNEHLTPLLFSTFTSLLCWTDKPSYAWRVSRLIRGVRTLVSFCLSI